MNNDVWPIVHAERAALIDDLARLDDDSWEHQSLCADWTVHDVVAHLIDTALTTRMGFLMGLARAWFDFDRQNARGVPARLTSAARVRRCAGARRAAGWRRRRRHVPPRPTGPTPTNRR